MSDAAAAAAPAAASGDAASATFVAGEKPGVTGSAPSNDSEVKAAIKKQVEYYFSDANFPKDKFLQAETAKSKEQWINISVLATFNRMKALVPSLDLQVIADALKDSTSLEVSEDGSKVRRELTRWQRTLGGVVYTGRNEVVTKAKELMEEGKAAEGGAISEEGQKFVLDLLQAHADPKSKEGPGVKAVKVGCNPEFPDTKCFVLERVDGSEVDFSYLKCVRRPKTPSALPEGRAASASPWAI